MTGQAQHIPFTDSRWEALDKKHPLEGEATDTTLKHTLVGGTDWWRTTERHSTNGPARGFYRDAKDSFEISAEITVNPEVQAVVGVPAEPPSWHCPIPVVRADPSDQATLFLYISPTRWVKAGIEFDNNALWNGAVVCNPYSDWSIAKRSPSDSKRYTIAYTGNEIKVYLGDDMIREVKWFGPTEKGDAKDGEEGRVFVGVMGCCPNEGGAKVVWENFTMREGVRSA